VEGGLYSYIDQGIQTFRYRMLAHNGSWESAGTVQRAVEINQPPVVMWTTFHPDGSLPLSDSFIAVEPENVMVTVLKQAEDSDDLVVRVVETSKATAHGVIRLPRWGRTIEANFKPGEIKTLRVPRNPSLPVIETSLLEE
jgi:alpha-mannosidase